VFLGEDEKIFTIVIAEEAKINLEYVYAVIVAVVIICSIFICAKCYCRQKNKPSKSFLTLHFGIRDTKTKTQKICFGKRIRRFSKPRTCVHPLRIKGRATDFRGGLDGRQFLMFFLDGREFCLVFGFFCIFKSILELKLLL